MSYNNIFYALFNVYTTERIFLTFTFCNLIKSELSVFMESTMNLIKNQMGMCDDVIKNRICEVLKNNSIDCDNVLHFTSVLHV